MSLHEVDVRNRPQFLALLESSSKLTEQAKDEREARAAKFIRGLNKK